MLFSYKPLLLQLTLRGIKKTKLQKDLGLSPTTIAKIEKHQILSMQILDKICDYLDCEIQDVIKHIKQDEKSRLKVSLIKPSHRIILEKYRQKD